MIETERLELIPLNARQLHLWVEELASLQNELSCAYQAEPLEGMFLNIVKGQLERTQKDPDNYVWHSFWLLIRKSDRVVVGSAGFKDIPNGNGEVELGYGLGQAFEHQGYMTEAVKAMCHWALKQETVAHVIAETETDGYASQKILRRCGFIKEKEADTLWWRRSVPEGPTGI